MLENSGYNPLPLLKVPDNVALPYPGLYPSAFTLQVWILPTVSEERLLLLK
jgi:hypothetical protein